MIPLVIIKSQTQYLTCSQDEAQPGFLARELLSVVWLMGALCFLLCICKTSVESDRKCHKNEMPDSIIVIKRWVYSHQCSL